MHLRTKKEMSKVPAHYELIRDILKLKNSLSPKTKLIVNGDIETPAAGQKFIDMGVDGLMIGRGVFHNPFCFEKTPRAHTREELIALLNYHLDLYEKYGLHPFDPLKHFFKIYINNFPGAPEIRDQLMQTKSIAEARIIIQDL